MCDTIIKHIIIIQIKMKVYNINVESLTNK